MHSVSMCDSHFRLKTLPTRVFCEESETVSEHSDTLVDVVLADFVEDDEGA